MRRSPGSPFWSREQPALLADGLGIRLEPRHARYLDNIRESGNQLLRLINNLLDQAKIEAGRMDLQLARLDAWTTLLALEHDLSRSGVPLVLFAFAAGSERGVAASFERSLHAPASGSELVAALAAAGLRESVLPVEGGPASPSRIQIWLASGTRNAPPELDLELTRAGFLTHRRAVPSRALAQAAGCESGAIVVDLADRRAGGLEMAVEGQTGRTSAVVWIALLAEELTSSERKRLVEYVESASGSAGAAVAAAAIRVTRGAAAAQRASREKARN